jgi:hypothetical protein
MFSPLSEALTKRIKAYGIGKKLLEVKVLNLWKETVENIFNKKVSGLARVLNFRNGVLSIGMFDSYSSQKIKEKKEKIVEILNEKLGGEVIKKINFKL